METKHGEIKKIDEENIKRYNFVIIDYNGIEDRDDFLYGNPRFTPFVWTVDNGKRLYFWHKRKGDTLISIKGRWLEKPTKEVKFYHYTRGAGYLLYDLGGRLTVSEDDKKLIPKPNANFNRGGLIGWVVEQKYNTACKKRKVLSEYSQIIKRADEIVVYYGHPDRYKEFGFHLIEKLNKVIDKERQKLSISTCLCKYPEKFNTEKFNSFDREIALEDIIMLSCVSHSEGGYVCVEDALRKKYELRRRWDTD